MKGKALTIDVSKFKSYTDGLMNHVYFVEHQFSLLPSKNHHLTAINFTSIHERKDDFLTALINTVSNWVYSKAERDKILDEQEHESGDRALAGAFLTNAANQKFRPGYPNGQFGELLLFNFLQHFFHAVPLLRKQRITTNIKLERNGADAIHYKQENGEHIFVLGESKCYESDYKFRDAFCKSLESIKTTLDSFSKELGLYTYDDFIENDLLQVAKAFKKGTLANTRIDLACLIIYNERKTLTKKDEKQIKADILKIVNERCALIQKDDYAGITDVIDSIQYIIFPIWALEDLLNEFQKKVGSEI